jgi:single-stranded DNA-specific DHH superfamily exonuclease
VIGILASRLKERYHRPTIAFADAGDGMLKGSARSVPGSISVMRWMRWRRATRT